MIQQLRALTPNHRNRFEAQYIHSKLTVAENTYNANSKWGRYRRISGVC